MLQIDTECYIVNDQMQQKSEFNVKDICYKIQTWYYDTINVRAIPSCGNFKVGIHNCYGLNRKVEPV